MASTLQKHRKRFLGGRYWKCCLKELSLDTGSLAMHFVSKDPPPKKKRAKKKKKKKKGKKRAKKKMTPYRMNIKVRFDCLLYNFFYLHRNGAIFRE